jgi:hypothetical protein
VTPRWPWREQDNDGVRPGDGAQGCVLCDMTVRALPHHQSTVIVGGGGGGSITDLIREVWQEGGGNNGRRHNCCGEDATKATDAGGATPHGRGGEPRQRMPTVGKKGAKVRCRRGHTITKD